MPGLDSAEVVTAPEDHLSTLTDLSDTAAPPQPAEPLSGKPEPTEVAPGARAPATAKPQRVSPPTPAERKFKIRGRDYTAAELAGKPEFLEDLAQTYEQFPHLQRRYQETLEQVVGAQTQPHTAAEPEAPLNAEMIHAAYKSQLDALAKAELIEPDLVELYPKALSQQLMFRDLLMDTRQAVAALIQRSAESSTDAQAADIYQVVGSAFDQLANHGGHFESLKDGNTRDDFFKYIVELNPQRKQLTPEFLGRQFVAYNQDVLLEAARRIQDQDQRERERQRRAAQGDGGGSRPARVPGQEPDHLFELVRG
jgi:hypothetical protein